jgi:hypothetical protein
MDEKKYYTYRYAYPQGFIADNGTDLSGVIFYVGKGTAGRMDAHEIEAEKGCRCAKCVAICSIWAKGMQVDKAKILETSDEDEALAYEVECIQEIYAGPYLTNYVHNQHGKREHSDLFSEGALKITIYLESSQVDRLEMLINHFNGVIGRDPKMLQLVFRYLIDTLPQEVFDGFAEYVQAKRLAKVLALEQKRLKKALIKSLQRPRRTLKFRDLAKD